MLNNKRKCVIHEIISDSTTGCILKPKAEILVNGIFLAAEE